MEAFMAVMVNIDHSRHDKTIMSTDRLAACLALAGWGN